MMLRERLSEVAAECDIEFLYPLRSHHTGRWSYHFGRSEKSKRVPLTFFAKHRVRDTEDIKNRATGAMTTPAMKDLRPRVDLYRAGNTGEKRDLQ
jgi:hypothetical protein